MRCLFEVAFKIDPMNLNDTLRCLEATWQKYLKSRGYYIYRGGTCLPVIRSHKDKKAWYRWLLLVSEVGKRFLSKAEQVHIHHQVVLCRYMISVTLRILVSRILFLVDTNAGDMI